MDVEPGGLAGLLLIKPKVIGDNRGFFMEGYRRDVLERAGLKADFVQDNHARSEKAGVVRGLHFQTGEAAQAKYVWVTAGAIFDVVVDIRPDSSSFGLWKSFILSAENKHRLFVPRGFAHGYMTLEPETELQYKVDAYYSPSHDSGIFWKDPQLAVNWPDFPPILSDKDKRLPLLHEYFNL
ncbi:MAG: dTDP-4-dehydrorhamnose 3,5-epimerase [Deltaproteobacteria bacterium]|jgi:dTDP-4-dehydrorhamnose 3,5-epimerase|nr:dTDP-4-dehydrorhamnose 3,5-epimerase [Deltaproteobacteria bacterium]